MMPIEEWLAEREANCLRLAEHKRGQDRAGWLEDAAYFKSAIDQLAEAKRLLSSADEAIRQLVTPESTARPEALEITNVLNTAKMLSDSLDGGFVRCTHCGEQEDTTDLDFAPQLREALARYEEFMNDSRGP